MIKALCTTAVLHKWQLSEYLEKYRHKQKTVIIGKVSGSIVPPDAKPQNVSVHSQENHFQKNFSPIFNRNLINFTVLSL